MWLIWVTVYVYIHMLNRIHDFVYARKQLSLSSKLRCRVLFLAPSRNVTYHAEHDFADQVLMEEKCVLLGEFGSFGWAPLLESVSVYSVYRVI